MYSNSYLFIYFAFSESNEIFNLKNKFYNPYMPIPIGLFFKLECLDISSG